MRLCKKVIIEFTKYILVGGTAFIVDFGTMVFTKEYFGINYLVAASIGFLIGLIVNYFLALKFVFNSSNGVNIKDFIYITIIGIVGLALTDIGMFIGVEIFKIHYTITKLIITGGVLIWNFGARKLFVYPTTKPL